MVRTFYQEELAVVGHPRLMPITLNKGRITSILEETVVFSHLIVSEEDAEACSLPKNQVKDIQTFFGPIKVCVIVIPSYTSNITILPGNSGSPLVTFFGKVVGVAFAGDNDSHWGFFVTRDDIIEFLKYY